MLRSLSYAARLLAATATIAMPVVAQAQADNRPIVVVFTFTNSAIGPNRADFDGIATGVQDLLITDLASNAKIRLVDRSKINDILAEQSLVTKGAIDPQTAIKVGKILGAQYAITGGFMSQGGTAVMTGRTIDIETTQIANPEKITGKPDDVLGLINQLSAKLSSGMVLTPKAGRKVGDAGDAGAKSPGAAQSGTPATKTAPGETFAHFVPPATVQKTMSTKLDVATMKTYSNALDEMDKKNKAKAIDLLKQVSAKYPDFEPAKRNLANLGA